MLISVLTVNLQIVTNTFGDGDPAGCQSLYPFVSRHSLTALLGVNQCSSLSNGPLTGAATPLKGRAFFYFPLFILSFLMNCHQFIVSWWHACQIKEWLSREEIAHFHGQMPRLNFSQNQIVYNDLRTTIYNHSYLKIQSAQVSKKFQAPMWVPQVANSLLSSNFKHKFLRLFYIIIV